VLNPSSFRNFFLEHAPVVLHFACKQVNTSIFKKFQLQQRNYGIKHEIQLLVLRALIEKAKHCHFQYVSDVTIFMFASLFSPCSA
jgi:hypothetical protein